MCPRCLWNHPHHCPAPPLVISSPTVPPAWTPKVQMGAGSTVSGAAASNRHCPGLQCQTLAFLPHQSSFLYPSSSSPTPVCPSISFPALYLIHLWSHSGSLALFNGIPAPAFPWPLMPCPLSLPLCFPPPSLALSALGTVGCKQQNNRTPLWLLLL
jgi:hypothetical protein